MKMIAPVKTWTAKRALLVLAPLVTTVLAVLGAVWAASADRAGVERTLKANEKRIEDHESRLRCVERSIPEMATDVKWIRSAMERNGKHGDK